MTTNDEMLYHYTTPDALIGIIQNRELWATNALYMNDSEELLHGLDIARRLIGDVAKEAGTDLAKQKANWLLQDLSITGPDHSMPTYVVSFSEVPDLLSQWRAYCRGGGFAIGFRRDLLDDYLEDQVDYVELKKCEYDTTYQELDIKQIIDIYAKPWLFDPQSENFGDGGRDGGKRFVVSGEFQWKLATVVDYVKNYAFREECEWRISTRPEAVRETRDEVCYRARGSMIIPYIKIKLPDKPAQYQEMALWRTSEIIVGPTRFPERSEKSVRMLFKNAMRFVPSIRISQVPYVEI